MAAIDIQGVTRRFDQLVAVDEVALSVTDGEIVGLLGHNGAGKTTLLRVINGLLRPDEGSIRVAGHDPFTEGAAVRSLTGVLTEYPALDEYLTTRENLEVYAAINGLPRSLARSKIDELLDLLGLADKGDVVTRGLSAGLKQRVALARSLVHDPRILLLDEPTTNMDPVAARIVRSLISEAAASQGRTVLLSTHNLVEAELLCDRVAIMRDGRLLAVGAPASLRREFGTGSGVRLQVGAHHLPDVARYLGDDLDLREVSVDTIEVHGPATVANILRRLVTADLDIHSAIPLEPSLEDLYIALHREEVAP